MLMAGNRFFRPAVLCYHAVASSWNHVLSTGPALVERQVTALLRAGYRPATVDELVDRPRERLLHVTFDDAYRNVVDAVDVLERLGIPSTVFVCSGFASDGGPIPVLELAGEAARHPDALATMTWDELRGLAARGVEIGSHTISHPHLPRLGEAAIERELVESKAHIEAELGSCRLLAYPYGEHDERARRAARAAGYVASFAVPRFRSAARELRGDVHALPRVGLFRGDGRLRTRLRASSVVRRAAALAAA
jgi:peptidoglycan/xylan/chitin deacetylase (PgdA/CDA1 family)